MREILFRGQTRRLGEKVWMSVDEMAKRLTACICIESEINFCLEKKECCEMLEKDIEIPNSLCLKCLENWLLKEAEAE